MVRGGSRLTLFPSLLLSCSCLASSRLCSAKASRGDSSGGASPAMCMRGDRKGLEVVEFADWFELDRKSSKLGRVAMVDVVWHR